MGGEKKRQPAAPVAQPEATKSAKKSKHYSYLEVVENVNKKNPLDVQVWNTHSLQLINHFAHQRIVYTRLDTAARLCLLGDWEAGADPSMSRYVSRKRCYGVHSISTCDPGA